MECLHLYNISSHVMSFYDIIATLCFFKNDNAYLQLIRSDIMRHSFTILLKMGCNSLDISIFIESHKI